MVVSAALGAGLGLAAAAGLLAATSGAGVARPWSQPERIEATHLPPLLAAAGEPVMLRYDVYCVGGDDAPDVCDARGTVYARARAADSFQALPLALDPGALEGRYAVRVPDVLARSGFSYYAVLSDARTGASVTLPAGAPAVREWSVPLGTSAVVVPLGRHTFGATRAADERVASAPWGDGAVDAGLEQAGPDATPIGASAFDVDATGVVTVLDEARRRLLRWSPGGSIPESVPVAVTGTIADVATAPGGTAYVLETAGHGSRALLRTFGPNGGERSSVDVGQGAAAVRTGPDGPVVLDPENGRWLSPGGSGAGIGRPFAAGLRVVVYRPDVGEVRVATVNDAGAVVRSWRIESATPVGEVQLAQPIAGKLLVVLRVYDETRAEFVVLVLGARGREQKFSLEAADWAETAPLGRFRFAAGSLYRLGSTPAAMFVDRYDLEVS
jgi:hypothetical protein